MFYHDILKPADKDINNAKQFEWSPHIEYQEIVSNTFQKVWSFCLPMGIKSLTENLWIEHRQIEILNISKTTSHFQIHRAF